MISEPKVLFHVLKNRRLSDAASCHGNQSYLLSWLCQGSALLPWPLPSVAAHFPRGLSHTTSALSPPPWPKRYKSQRASGPAFLYKGHPHTHTPAERVRGHDPGLDTLLCPGITFLCSIAEGTSHSEKSTNEKRTLLKYLQGTRLRIFSNITHSETLSLFPGCSVWQLRHVTAKCGDRRRGSSLWCLFGLSALPAASPGPKGITRPSSICLHIPQYLTKGPHSLRGRWLRLGLSTPSSHCLGSGVWCRDLCSSSFSVTEGYWGAEVKSNPSVFRWNQPKIIFHRCFHISSTACCNS